MIDLIIVTIVVAAIFAIIFYNFYFKRLNLPPGNLFYLIHQLYSYTYTHSASAFYKCAHPNEDFVKQKFIMQF